jgi:pyruvate formate lyase activating enzyme
MISEALVTQLVGVIFQRPHRLDNSRVELFNNMERAPIISISRFRIGTDGNGITSLVCFHGCPMRCKYCLNPQSINPNTKYYILSSHELAKHLAKDELYYIATGGGVTFGGGEPLLYSSFIEEVLQSVPSMWSIHIETSLNVPLENLTKLFDYNVHFIVDVKDMNSSIYKDYTSCSNEQVVNNLTCLSNKGLTNRVSIRLPLIKKYNDSESQRLSKKELISMGYYDIEEFAYITNIKDYKYERKRTMQNSPCCEI